MTTRATDLRLSQPSCLSLLALRIFGQRVYIIISKFEKMLMGKLNFCFSLRFLLGAEHKDIDIRFEYFKLSEPEKTKRCTGVSDNQFALKALLASEGYMWCKKKKRKGVYH